MVADVLAIQGAKASATMIFTLVKQIDSLGLKRINLLGLERINSLGLTICYLCLALNVSRLQAFLCQN